MKNLIVYLEAVRQTAKVWHYSASGPAFYSDHLLADRIGDPISGFIDDIKEVCFLGNEREEPSSNEIAAGVIETTTGKTGDALCLNGFIVLALYHIEELAKSDIMQGSVNLLGTIAEHLQRSRGFLWRRSVEREE